MNDELHSDLKEIHGCFKNFFWTYGYEMFVKESFFISKLWAKKSIQNFNFQLLKLWKEIHLHSKFKSGNIYFRIMSYKPTLTYLSGDILVFIYLPTYLHSQYFRKSKQNPISNSRELKYDILHLLLKIKEVGFHKFQE